MACNHLRQNRLPCAVPRCPTSIKADEISTTVITSKGRRLGWTYDEGECPTEYQRALKWKRVRIGKPAQSNLDFYFWLPQVEEDVSFQKCFHSFIPLFCPKDGTLLAKSKIYKKQVTYILSCPVCSTRYVLAFDVRENVVTWKTPKGEYVGENGGYPVFEYPE